MKLNQSLNHRQTSDYNQLLKRPNPPTTEMVEKAQPFRADTLQKLEAVIKFSATPIDV
jgi:hypothetical protein